MRSNSKGRLHIYTAAVSSYPSLVQVFKNCASSVVFHQIHKATSEGFFLVESLFFVSWNRKIMWCPWSTRGITQQYILRVNKWSHSFMFWMCWSCLVQRVLMVFLLWIYKDIKEHFHRGPVEVVWTVFSGCLSSFPSVLKQVVLPEIIDSSDKMEQVEEIFSLSVTPDLFCDPSKPFPLRNYSAIVISL